MILAMDRWAKEKRRRERNWAHWHLRSPEGKKRGRNPFNSQAHRFAIKHGIWHGRGRGRRGGRELGIEG
jgi:hypothetical protein